MARNLNCATLNRRDLPFCFQCHSSCYQRNWDGNGSDIHFSTKFNVEKILHTDVRDQLLNDLRDAIVPRLGNMDKVLIAGDIAFSG
ncbi:MAG TPA: hypothetical protein VE604_13465, partial [Candidatus Polarisedimenticolia bacterium]|nr:hypothetical protein [Candidatus Polarisedimenticolia bacterium]